ncbi:MAG: DUF4268 domain-containing protein [Candidatus Bathyarchaeales archaeon]
MAVSKLNRVPVRQVWKNEEKDFTPWLAKNIEILGETLGMPLSVVEKETDVGESFEADILAEGKDGIPVVIENQFGKTDHDHLGKLITYSTNLEAKIAIWICENPQPEHVAAIDWLNKNTSGDISFYLIKLEAFQINGSPVAPHFSIISEPSKVIREAGEMKEELAERHIKRLEFWRQLLEKSSLDIFSNVSPSKDHWIAAGAGKSGLSYNYVILMNSARVEFYISTPDAAKNKKIFDELYKRRQEIEKDFGEELEWQRLDDKTASRVAKTVSQKGLMNVEEWSDIQSKMIDAMRRLEKAISKHIKTIG